MIKAVLVSFTTAFLLTIGTVGFSGCDKADEAFDCQSACQTYADCIDDDYDVSECASRCRDNAENDEDFSDKADACESCLDDKSCVESVFQCGGDCIGIVP